MPSLRTTLATILVVIVLGLPASVLAVVDDGPGAVPLADEVTRFTDVTQDAGFPDDLARTRVAWGDYDDDGWEDLLLDGRMLWRNKGDGTFMDVTSAAGIGGVPGVGGVWADYDNDGDLDFYTIVRSFTKRDALWQNDGDGTFTDVTMMSGEVYDYLPSEGAAWGDWDNDGYVDLYVANYETASVRSDDELGIGTPDSFYWNRGDGTFWNVSSLVEPNDEPLCGRGVVWADYDDDGDLDIYVSNYRLDPNLLWRNDQGAGLGNFAMPAGVEGTSIGDLPGNPRYGHTIGSDFGDYDNDGDMDLYASNLAHPRFLLFSDVSMLLNNQGDGTFNDQFKRSGIAYCETSSDPSWVDYDNDGDLDLFFTAVYEGVGSRMFRNTDRNRFEDATEESRTSVEDGWGTGWCDYDHDGDMDLAVGSGSGFRLLQNGGNDNHWLLLKLEGTHVNSKAIGTRVRVTAGDLTMVREVKGGRGTTSQDMLTCHFGLGSYEGYAMVDIRWPGDTEWIHIGGFGADQRIFISQDEGDADMEVRIDVVPDDPEVGEAVEIVATLENVGSSTFSEVDYDIFINGAKESGGGYFGSLSPGWTRQMEFPWQPMEEGDYTIECRITESSPHDTNPDNNVAKLGVTVRGQNQEPIARLQVSPLEGPPESTITLDASASTDDSSIALYFFEFGDGTDSGWTASPVISHVYSMAGEFLVSLTVEDEHGLRSTNFVTALITITSMGYRPTAEIVTVLPNPARQGDAVTLHGKGLAVGDTNIAGHSWNSSIDGHLGDVAIVTVSTLSVDEHTIIYKVRDERGLWSDPATAVLEILPPEGDWEIAISESGGHRRGEGGQRAMGGCNRHGNVEARRGPDLPGRRSPHDQGPGLLPPLGVRAGLRQLHPR
jgi:hypothetical protein